MAENTTYSIGKTATKAAPPLFVILLVPAAKAALSAAGITIDDTTLYTIALYGFSAIIGIINYLKNRNKGKDK